MIVVMVLALLFSNTLMPAFKLGLENIPPSLRNSLNQKSVALVVSDQSVDQKGQSAISYLHDQGIVPSAIYCVEESYGSKPLSCLINTPEQELQETDVLLVDLPDLGLNSSESIHIVEKLLAVAARYDKEIIILDRPNPLGARMEGPQSSSDQGLVELPLLHGMTLGELAWFCNMHALGKPAKLHVVTMHDYARDFQSGHSYVMPLLLKNIKPLHTTATSIIVPKQNTTESFWSTFAHSFNKLGFTVSYVSEPSSIRLLFTNAESVSYFKSALYLLDTLQKNDYSVSFNNASPMNASVSNLIKAYCDDEDECALLVAQMNDELFYFFNKARTSFMYMPLPEICEFSLS